MGLIEAIDKLITERGSAAVLDKHLAFVREQARSLEKQVAALQQENTALKQRLSQLESELAAKSKTEEFVEHRGAFFKRKPGGGYHLAVYCPSCHGAMGCGFAEFPYQCGKCKIVLDFREHDLQRIMKELP